MAFLEPAVRKDGQNDYLHIPKLDRLSRVLFGGKDYKVRKIREAFRWNEHREIEEFPEDYEHGAFLYDTVLKVPLIIWGKGLPSGRIVEQQAQSIDIMPTALELLGMEDALKRGRVNGRPLLKYLRGDEDDYRYAYSETKKDRETERENTIDKTCLRSKDGYKLIMDNKKIRPVCTIAVAGRGKISKNRCLSSPPN